MLPAKLFNTSDKRRSIANQLVTLLTVYGLPQANRLVPTLLDISRSQSFYSYANLFKLSADFGTAYCVSSLLISLGRRPKDEAADLIELFPCVQILDLINNEGLPSLAQVPLYYEDDFSYLNAITQWFGYLAFKHPGDYLEQPKSLVAWIDPPYSELFLTLEPKAFIRKALEFHQLPADSQELLTLLNQTFDS